MAPVWCLQEESMDHWQEALFATSCSSTGSSSDDDKQQQMDPGAARKQQLPTSIDDLRYILALVRNILTVLADTTTCTGSHKL
jgi:hypothetical protein